jgi:hypothetical protein
MHTVPHKPVSFYIGTPLLSIEVERHEECLYFMEQCDLIMANVINTLSADPTEIQDRAATRLLRIMRDVDTMYKASDVLAMHALHAQMVVVFHYYFQ